MKGPLTSSTIPTLDNFNINLFTPNPHFTLTNQNLCLKLTPGGNPERYLKFDLHKLLDAAVAGISCQGTRYCTSLLFLPIKLEANL